MSENIILALIASPTSIAVLYLTLQILRVGISKSKNGSTNGVKSGMEHDVIVSLTSVSLKLDNVAGRIETNNNLFMNYIDEVKMHRDEATRSLKELVLATQGIKASVSDVDKSLAEAKKRQITPIKLAKALSRMRKQK